MSSNNVDLMVGNRPLSSLRVVDLKQELEKRGLSKSGTKKDLAERLRLHLTIEKHRDSGAAASEEELPNYSVHGDLADQNPFIRDYLASQAELFHSQKVVKKLVEEEAKRESETSADESTDSPVKQPPPEPSPVILKEDSPAPATETRRQTRRRLDSQKEEMTAEKLVTTRSSRSRSPAAATEPNNIQVQNQQPKPTEAAAPPQEEPKPPEEEKEEPASIISPQQKTVKVPVVSPVKTPEQTPRTEQTKAEKPEQKKEIVKAEEPEQKKEIVESLPTIVKPTPIPEKIPEEVPPSPPKTKASEEHVSASVPKEEPVKDTTSTLQTQVDNEEPTKKSSETETLEKQETLEAAMAVDVESKAAEVNNSENLRIPPSSSPMSVEIQHKFSEVRQENKTAKAAGSPEKSVEEVMKIDASKEKERSRSSSPVAKGEAPERRKEADVSKDKDSGSSSDDDDSSSRSRGRSKSKSRSRSRSESKSRSRSRSRSVDSRDSRGGDSTANKRSDVEENDEESRDEDSSRVESPKKIRRSRSRSLSRSPVREKSPLKKKEDINEDQDRKDKSDTQSEVKSPEEKMDDSVSPRYKSSQKETFSKFDLAGEEALDYGEEEDDEDKNDSDAQEFKWARRTLRLKSKPVVTAVPACKWKLEEDSKHLLVKSNLLNEYYEDIKLVPLELLKLEEKSSESPEKPSVEEVERKPSISHDIEPELPLPTRTVENVSPIIKRTISITVTNSQVPLDHQEENDKTLTPPRNPPSNVLLITNLVRPFTLPQLKEMLQRTGNLQDIWVDKIKSKCIAKYVSQEEAFETRAALHGVCWPASNPKSLHVDYSTQDNLDEHKAKDNVDQNSVSEKPVTAQHLPVREWDVGKKTEPKSPSRSRKRSRSRSTSRDRNKRSRRTPSPGRRRHSSRSPVTERRSRGGEGKEPEPMGKALDELFRKTVATPSIYWLPLTPEQIAEKEELRRKRMLERERRLAELSKMRPR